MDEIGRRYVLLALRLGRHLPDFIASYIGPAELAEAVSGEDPAPPEELHAEAMALHDEVIELGESQGQRGAWLADQLRAMATSARLLAGEEVALVDLVEELYGIAAEPEPQATFDSAHRLLDDALPAGSTLAARLAAHESDVELPSDLVLRALRRATSALRRRVAQDLWLPDGEAIRLATAAGSARSPWASYLGGLQTRLEVDPLQPITLGGAVDLAAREGYPGRHAERATKEALLMRERELGEASVTCRFTPEQAISDGLAEVARPVVLGDMELGALLLRLVRDLGLRVAPAAVEREVAVARARTLLSRAPLNAALLRWRDGVPEPEVLDWLAGAALLDPPHAIAEMGRVETLHGAVGAFSHLTGSRLMAEWLEVQGQTHGLSRLLSEQLTPSQLRLEVVGL